MTPPYPPGNKSPRKEPQTVAGIYTGIFSAGLGFRYTYTCDRCGNTFFEYAPEVTAPCLCHSCYAGLDSNHHRKRRKKR